MKKILKKTAVLLAIFVLAVAGYFIWSMKNTKSGAPDMRFTSIEDANLPVVYMEMFGVKMNCLHGYLQESGSVAGRDSLTILPDDRRLAIYIQDNQDKVTGLQYEIRSLDGSRLVERTALEEWTQEEGAVKAVLPIQNLLTKEAEYMLTLRLTMEAAGSISYYTRIMWSDNTYAEDMINLAKDFSSKTFDYNQAMELTTYLETETTADNSSLGRVSLKTSFNQLTWGGLDVEPTGPVSVTLKELEGISANIQLDYMVLRNVEDEKQEFYEVSENFTMKWNPQRIYMMNYNREMDQIFTGDGSLFSGKRILLGINSARNLQALSDESGGYQAFVVNRELWCLDRENDKAVKIFSFRGGDDGDVRSDYRQHGVKILSVGEEGNVDFLVYGYMNRGNHEGYVGAALYTYHMDGNSIDERFFIPVEESFDLLEQDVGQLCYLNSNNMFYILVDHAIFAIDLSSNEYMVVADALVEGSYAVSADKTRIAWQEGDDPYGSKLIHLMNLETGKKDELTKPDDKILKVLGFVGNDFVYGLANPGDLLALNGRVTGLPMYSIEIIGDDMNVQTKYEKDGVYISDVSIQDSRIHLTKMVKSGASFIKTEEDTLVCNVELPVDELAGIGWYASTDREKLYFVQLDKELDRNQNIRVGIPRKFAGRLDSTISLKAGRTSKPLLFYAYGGGRFQGSFTEFPDAVAAAHGVMGLVTDSDQEILWVRANRSTSKTVKDVSRFNRRLMEYLENFDKSKRFEDGALMLDARGLSVSQTLYFVDQGCPVIAYTGEGTYVLIYGYDQYNISVYDPVSQATEKIGLNDANTYFSGLGNDFICTLFTE